MSVKRSWMAVVAIAAALTAWSDAQAANVTAMSYDRSTDQLVLEVSYRGTNDQHSFTVNWEECKDYAFVDAKYQIMGNLVDSEPNDRGTNEFTKDLRFSLASIECRPVKLTIRSSPGFFRTIIVPALAD
jgi:hypothetical protein